MPTILDGKLIRDQLNAESKPRVDALRAAHRAPGLAVVLVGHDPASEIYVRNKVKTCGELGIFGEEHKPPASATTDELKAMLRPSDLPMDMEKAGKPAPPSKPNRQPDLF